MKYFEYMRAHDFRSFALIFILVRCKHYVICPAAVQWANVFINGGLWIINVVCVQVAIIGVKHVLGTRLLQKCLRHSPPGVVCTQV